MKTFVGMNKAPDRASICLWPEDGDFALVLKERVTRKKNDGGSVDQLLLQFAKSRVGVEVAENSYLRRPHAAEMDLNQHAPYFERQRQLGLTSYSSEWNPNLQFLPHHYCHAMAAVAVSPFERSLIVVLDCTGNEARDFPHGHPEPLRFPAPAGGSGKVTEACTVYLQDRHRIHCVEKNWQIFRTVPGPRPLRISGGLGRLYEASSQYIFNSINESGKVMGLAPFGRPKPIDDREAFVVGWDWNKAFRFRGKEKWENSGHFDLYADIAASVQNHFEESIWSMMRDLRRRFPQYRNLIFTGGSALNCVMNMKLLESGLFDEIYVPPFPGDECISLGAASHLRFLTQPESWRPIAWAEQRADFGPLPPSARIGTKQRDIEAEAAERLADGQILAWFQGRSESGPRALGKRSILADPRVEGLKERLNREFKFRESFRPYGCSCPAELVSKYFRVGGGFRSPFMSFAPFIRDQYEYDLREVSHIDGTSRVQTVEKSQLPRFHRVLTEFGSRTGLACLLNTSLNVMGEPIVETEQDLVRFLEHVPVDAAIIDDRLLVSRHRSTMRSSSKRSFIRPATSSRNLGSSNL